MKLLLAALLAVASTTAIAQHRHPGHSGFHHRHFHHKHWHPHHGWVVPTIIGGVVVYEIMKNQQPAPPVIIQQEPAPPITVCGEWKEIMTSDGKVYRERTCTTQ